jgi:hypothetical protein
MKDNRNRLNQRVIDLMQADRFEEALDPARRAVVMAKQSLEIRGATLPQNHLEIAESLDRLALLLITSGRGGRLQCQTRRRLPPGHRREMGQMGQAPGAKNPDAVRQKARLRQVMGDKNGGDLVMALMRF